MLGPQPHHRQQTELLPSACRIVGLPPRHPSTRSNRRPEPGHGAMAFDAACRPPRQSGQTQGTCSPMPSSAGYLKTFFPPFPSNPLYDPELLAWKIFLLARNSYPIRPLPRFETIWATAVGSSFPARLEPLQMRSTSTRSSGPILFDRGKRGRNAIGRLCSGGRSLTESQEPHRARLQEDFLASVGSIPEEALPGRISVFGVTSLPPYHTSLLAAVRLEDSRKPFRSNPSAEYWDQIVSGHEAAQDRDERIPGDHSRQRPASRRRESASRLARPLRPGLPGGPA